MEDDVDTRWIRVGLMAVAVSALMIVGCGDDLYSECTIEAESGSTVEQCQHEGDSEVSCVVDQQLECESGRCARYRNSEPYCTMRCDNDGECPSGECREFPYQSGERHCVANSDL